MMQDPIVYWSITALVLVIAFVLTAFNAKHWIGAGRYLCEDCKFNTAEDCHKAERPTALDCTAYRPTGGSGIPSLPEGPGIPSLPGGAGVPPASNPGDPNVPPASATTT